MLAGRAHAGAGDADVDRHRQAQLGTGGVHGVVELVVEGVLVDERRDPHQRHGRVLGQRVQATHLLDGPVGPVGRECDAQAVGVGGHLVEQRARLLGADARGDDADVDAALVHGDEQVLQRGGGREITAEQLRDAFIPGLAHEGGGGLAGQAH